MFCPQCNSSQDSVIDTRPREHYVYRRRKCITCNHRFTTIEIKTNCIKDKEISLLDQKINFKYLDIKGKKW